AGASLIDAQITIPIERKGEKLTALDHLKIANTRHKLGIKGLKDHRATSLKNWQNSLYTAQVTIGNNQIFTVDLDTGSSDIWLRGPACKSTDSSCTNGPSVNITDATLLSTGGTFSDAYGDGSTVSGVIYRGPVTLGGVTATVNFGVTTKASGMTGPYDGLWGLGFWPLNSIDPVTVKGNFVAAAGIGGFAFYFSDYTDKDTGELTINGVDTAKFTGPVQWVPLTALTYWQFSPVGGSFVVNGVSIPMTGNSAIADTGTTLMIVPTAVAAKINAAIGAAPVNSQGFSPISCSLNSPSITVNIGNSTIVVTAKQYVFQYGATCISGIVGGGASPDYIFGDVFLRAAYSIYDVTNKRVGFAQAIHPGSPIPTPSVPSTTTVKPATTVASPPSPPAPTKTSTAVTSSPSPSTAKTTSIPPTPSTTIPKTTSVPPSPTVPKTTSAPLSKTTTPSPTVSKTTSVIASSKTTSVLKTTPVTTKVPCAHDKCVIGPYLQAACDPCVASIVAKDAYCGVVTWDSTCVKEVQTICGVKC
ncbi:hypothetical protein HDU99_000179, partial [Rhizoclosmatium hyalinum]